jgi:hypothetical protein
VSVMYGGTKSMSKLDWDFYLGVQRKLVAGAHTSFLQTLGKSGVVSEPS